ncbi:ExeM/NucH family extracellular endonuclease [Neolewinella litorea]|uniref:ExeM/NucH family extracellular endonuclease n=1 Tax=Neolewinella litorea TaxID=2562452 RepID=UPI0014562130|nr:ExeM/NucH family extracellular endonuclease [Neolewinella litorea]
MKPFYLALALLLSLPFQAQDRGPGDDRVFGPATGETVIRIDLSVLDDAVQEVRKTGLRPRPTDADTAVQSRAGSVPSPDTVAIHTVQGSGATSPLTGTKVTVQGIVTGDFQDGLRGFYLQEEDEDADVDTLTSEGIFVFAGSPDVEVGDRVTVTAEVEEYFGQTQLRGADAGATITVESQGLRLPQSTPLTLPRTGPALEALEGMRVDLNNVVMTRVDNLDRFGEVEVTSGERLAQFTECNLPDSVAYRAYLDSLANDVLVVDDGRGGTNLSPVRLPDGSTLTTATGLRAGQTIEGLTGILGYGFDRYRLQPTEYGTVTLSGNPRPTAAPEVGGEIRVVSANVLNYFTTLQQRGADTESELLRQEAKIVAALCTLDADILGLIEIENNDNVALRRLVDALNASCDRQYDLVRSPDTGDDDITVALVYRGDRLTESGTAAALSTPESLFRGRGSNRVPLAQTFRVIDSASSNLDREVTVVVNHFKSKGSACGSGDDDANGAGNCNGTRTAAARAIVDWLATYPTGVQEDNILVVGDLNSYRLEAPIEVFRAAGYVNTRTTDNDQFPCGGGPPSYVFGGQWGSLDYALASPSLAAHVTGATAWTVNAPEPDVLDYNQEGAGNALYAPDFYRFSDHDPIVVGLDLSAEANGIAPSGTASASVTLQRIDVATYVLEGITRPGSYLLTNSAGQLMASGSAPAGGTARVSVAGFPTGVYFLVLRQEGSEALTFKVIVP